MVVMALDNKVGYRSVVSQNDVTGVFKILDIFRTAKSLLKCTVCLVLCPKYIDYFKNPLYYFVKPPSYTLICEFINGPVTQLISHYFMP